MPVRSIVIGFFCFLMVGCAPQDNDAVTPAPSYVEFAYPLGAGTTWHYRYSRSYRRFPTYYDVYGHQVWRSAGFATPDAVTILVTRTDTTMTYPRAVGMDTTTVITQSDTSFSIIVTSDSLQIRWFEFAMHGFQIEVQELFSIPRVVESSKDSIALRGRYTSGASSYKRAVYVSGKGLSSWVDYNSSNTFYEERLTLESLSL